MPNLKEVRNRIGSVTSTRQITSAMKLVSAAKLRRAQDAIQKMRPYAEKLEDILTNLSENIDAGEIKYARQVKNIEHVTLVVITSNRGLCGAFNSQIIKKAIAYLQTHYSSQVQSGNISIVTLGKAATTAFTKRGFKVDAFNDIYDNLTFEAVIPIAEQLMQNFTEGKTDKVEVFYNQFKSAATQISTQEKFLPLNTEKKKAEAEKSESKIENKAKTDYIFEPGKEEIVQNLIPLSLKTTLFKAVLDSNAAEHGARMTAMHKATDNAGELLNDLKLSYNKARQAAITNEILEIVAGAEALNG